MRQTRLFMNKVTEYQNSLQMQLILIAFKIMVTENI